MMIIKLFESFINRGLESNIKDILVELNDIGIDYYVSSHKNVIEVEINKEPIEQEDEEGNYNPDGIYNYELGIQPTNLFNFEDIYEPVMTLLSFMRDKYPSMIVEYSMNVNNHEETDDWFEEFLEENDLESVTLDDVKQFTNISSFDIEFTLL